jgi:TPR repeat protein
LKEDHLTLAAQLALRAAENDHPNRSALLMLSRMYKYGLGVKSCPSSAKKWKLKYLQCTRVILQI